MPRTTIDTTEALSFEPTEPGPYAMKIEEIGAVAKGDKAHYIPVKYVFLDPDVAKRCGSVWRNYPIDGKGAGFFRDLWKALTGEELPLGGRFDVDTDDILGREVIAQIDNKEYEGRLTNEVKQVTSA